MPITIHMLNATGALSDSKADIDSAFRAATTQAEAALKLTTADVLVNSNPDYAIPELGVGGYTDSTNKTIYLSIDPEKRPTSQAITACLSHEFYHLARHQLVGVPLTLEDRAIDEGLACLYESEVTDEVPVYARQKITDKYLTLFMKHANDKNDTDKWFFGGDGIPKWFAYSLGFKLVTRYKKRTGKTAPQMVDVNSRPLYDKTLGSAKLSILD